MANDDYAREVRVLGSFCRDTIWNCSLNDFCFTQSTLARKVRLGLAIAVMHETWILVLLMVAASAALSSRAGALLIPCKLETTMCYSLEATCLAQICEVYVASSALEATAMCREEAEMVPCFNPVCAIDLCLLVAYVSELPTPTFSIELEMFSPEQAHTADARRVFDLAKSRLAQIVTGQSLINANVVLRVLWGVQSIDGVGGVLGSAFNQERFGVCVSPVNGSTSYPSQTLPGCQYDLMPTVGVVQFDVSDFTFMSDAPLWEELWVDLVTHELLHMLGIGTFLAEDRL
ncbi:hypothetical protein FVE85_0042 [Porphyridium purpureum]|uniref:Uncharacterized protein n=1 Tax=Porphyridium purpureum TaxID=35688 RepID=A0A5J4Z0G5_PORPP|nr:hypothetical protein FVE85_0042 [Porphyridium purpureum]|eukprot:POR8572..scf208_2